MPIIQEFFRNSVVQIADKGTFPEVLGEYNITTEQNYYSSGTINLPIVPTSMLVRNEKQRFLYEEDYPAVKKNKIILCDKPERIFFLDIETDFDQREDFQRQFEACDKMITAITCEDLLTGEFFHESIHSKYLTDPDVSNMERDMIIRFFNFFVGYRCIIVAFNANFDASYISRRNRKLNGFEGGFGLTPVIDYISLYKRYKKMNEPSFKLGYLLEKYLGIGKVEYTGSLYDLYRTDFETYDRYNVEDVKRLIQMEKLPELHLLSVASRIVEITGCSWFDIVYNSKILESYFYNTLKTAGLTFRNKLQYNAVDDDESYEGAIVYDPMPGLYRDSVRCYDFASMYPMIMLKFNISPETLVSEHFKGPTIEAAGGGLYRTDMMGFVPSAVRYFLDERNKSKKSGDKIGDQAFKVLANSMYGVMGFHRFRLYEKQCAADITATGQELNKFVARNIDENTGAKAKFFDYHEAWERKKIIFGHTDSVYVNDPRPLADTINGWLQQYEEHYGCQLQHVFKFAVKDEYELIKAIIMRSVKSTYYLKKQDGTYKFTGGSIVKSDVTPACKEVSEHIIKSLLDGTMNVDDVPIFIEEAAGQIDVGMIDVYKPFKYNPFKAYKVTRPCIGGMEFFKKLYPEYIGHDERGVLVPILLPPATTRAKKPVEAVIAIPESWCDIFAEVIEDIRGQYTIDTDKICEWIFNPILDVYKDLKGIQ